MKSLNTSKGRRGAEEKTSGETIVNMLAFVLATILVMAIYSHFNN